MARKPESPPPPFNGAYGSPLHQAHEEPIRPFRLVKYFSFTGFMVILVFTMALTLLISSQAKNLTLKKSDDYAMLLADNLNHQVFLQFVVPTALRFGRIRLREKEQFDALDAVVRNTIHSFKVKKVNIYDLEGRISYSTEADLVGKAVVSPAAYREALRGHKSSTLLTQPGKSLTGLDKAWTLQTFFPFRGEVPYRGSVGDVLGVFEIYQDLTNEYADITKFQYLSIAISLGISALVFVILRQIIVKGEMIIEERNEGQRRLEEKLHNSEKLATLGQMIAAVSHEIRNPLGIISSTGEILQEKIKAYEPNNRLAEVIVEESRRLNGIVTEFLDFARPQIPRPTSCRLEEIIEANLNFLSPVTTKENIEIIRDYQGTDLIDADPDLLYRAFLNIFVNSIQAMPKGGALTVSTSLPYGPDGKGLGCAEVVVADTGEGVDPEKIKNLFNPFFTTKNRGSGLGLAIVKNIVEGHQGQVKIEPGTPSGTKVTIRLPINHN
ncbi:MAG: ATP-binding protein [Pseudomonadota bacterium]